CTRMLDFLLWVTNAQVDSPISGCLPDRRASFIEMRELPSGFFDRYKGLVHHGLPSDGDHLRMACEIFSLLSHLCDSAHTCCKARSAKVIWVVFGRLAVVATPAGLIVQCGICFSIECTDAKTQFPKLTI